MLYQFYRSKVLFIGLLLLALGSTAGAVVVFGVFWATFVILYDMLVIGWVIWNWGLEVVFKPTDPRTSQIMLEAACLAPGETVYDLGAGDGRLLIMAARRYGAKGFGVEIDPLRFWVARLSIGIFGMQHRIKMVRADIRDIDLSPADVVFMYLSIDLNSELRSKFSKELTENARVVSYVYPIVGWEPVEVLPSVQPGENVYLYHSHSWIPIRQSIEDIDLSEQCPMAPILPLQVGRALRY